MRREVIVNALAGVVVGALYGWLLQRVYMADQNRDLAGVLTLTFLLVVPAVAGVLCIVVGERRQRHSWPARIFLPWVSCLCLFAAAIAVGFYALICLILAMPVFLLMASLGGVIGGVIGDAVRGRGPVTPALALGLLPFVLVPVERQFPALDAHRTVETSIDVAADAGAVWRQISRVPPIQAHEQRPSLFHLLRIPRPLEATLDSSGVGGRRHGLFESELRFVETITVWEPGRELAFAIRADTSGVPPGPTYDLRLIGSRYFDVYQARYRLEPLGPNRTRLHLSSTHRLTTRFNGYAGLWTDAILRDFQDYVLRVVKSRAEAA